MKRHITANGHNVTRVKFDMKGHLGKEEFNSRIQMLVKNHPDLGSSFVQDATGKSGQEFHEEKQAAVYYRDLSRLSEPAANRLLSGFWQVMEENDDVLAAACFPLPDGNTAVLFQVEDTGADDRLARIVQDELAMNWQRGAIYLQSLYQM